MIPKHLKQSVPMAKPVNVPESGSYKGNELKPYEGRPNAMDAFSLPSIMGNKRVWRDGRVEIIKDES